MKGSQETLPRHKIALVYYIGSADGFEIVLNKIVLKEKEERSKVNNIKLC